MLASVFDALNLNPCVVNGANYHRATEVVAQALTLARAEALEEAAKLAEVYKHETPFSPFGLATRIRSLSSQPTTPAETPEVTTPLDLKQFDADYRKARGWTPGKGMTREDWAQWYDGFLGPCIGNPERLDVIRYRRVQASLKFADAILAKLKGEG